MSQKRVRIVDIAEALGLSTATVSNVIHGKTSKISDETVKRVHKELKEQDISLIWQVFCWQEIIPESLAW